MKNLAENNISSREREDRFFKKNELTKNWVGRLKQDNLIFALYSFFEEQDINKAKQFFYNCGLLDAFRVRNFNDGMFVYDLHSIGYALLSDNTQFLKENYAHLIFSDFYLEDDTNKRIDRTMEDHILEGEDGCIFVHTVQQFLLENNALIERNLEIMEHILYLRYY